MEILPAPQGGTQGVEERFHSLLNLPGDTAVLQVCHWDVLD